MICFDPSLGLMTKVRACKGVGRKGSLEIILHTVESVRKCEGMRLHTPKWAFTFGVRILMDFWIFIDVFHRSKFIGSKRSLYHWKYLEMKMSKMGLHDSLEYLKHKLWLRVKVSIWLPTTKSQESPWNTCF